MQPLTHFLADSQVRQLSPSALAAVQARIDNMSVEQMVRLARLFKAWNIAWAKDPLTMAENAIKYVQQRGSTDG